MLVAPSTLGPSLKLCLHPHPHSHIRPRHPQRQSSGMQPEPHHQPQHPKHDPTKRAIHEALTLPLQVALLTVRAYSICNGPTALLVRRGHGLASSYNASSEDSHCRSSREPPRPSAILRTIDLVHGQGGVCSRSHCSVFRWPPSVANVQAHSSQGTPCVRAQISISRCPPLAAEEAVSASQGHRGVWARSHWSTSKWPCSAAAWHILVLHGHRIWRERSQIKTCSWPCAAA